MTEQCVLLDAGGQVREGGPDPDRERVAASALPGYVEGPASSSARARVWQMLEGLPRYRRHAEYKVREAKKAGRSPELELFTWLERLLFQGDWVNLAPALHAEAASAHALADSLGRDDFVAMDWGALVSQVQGITLRTGAAG